MQAQKTDYYNKFVHLHLGVFVEEFTIQTSLVYAIGVHILLTQTLFKVNKGVDYRHYKPYQIT